MIVRSPEARLLLRRWLRGERILAHEFQVRGGIQVALAIEGWGRRVRRRRRGVTGPKQAPG